MPRKCTICNHKDQEKIDKAILEGVPIRRIVAQFGTSQGTVQRHKRHVSQKLLKAKEVKEVAQADTLIDELRKYRKRVELLFDACDRWLRDPDNPDQYDLSPRENEVRVIYTEKVGKSIVQKKENLTILLRKIEKSGRVPIYWEYKNADPRELILKTAAQLNKQLELLGRISGELENSPPVNIFVNPDFIIVKKILMEELKDYPGQQIKIAERLGDAARTRSDS